MFFQVSRTLLSILADINSSVIWMISIHLPISKFSSHFPIPLETVPCASITVGITVTLMLHRFLSSRTRSKYLFLFSLSFIFTLWPAGIAKFTIRQIPTPIFCYRSLGLVFRPEFNNLFVSQNPVNFMRFIHQDGFSFFMYHLVVWLDFTLLHCSQFIIFPHSVMPRLVLLLC